ncbi:MAG: 4-hydroxy-tetrahydrodipicolinate synthase [Bacteroidetes bacterium]|nr:4-hydroxy-tetrahydrodipicolinate synthase [Bacteroidota bacterium]
MTQGLDTSFLKGTGVALITPFKENEEIDFEALSKIIDHVILGGVNYVVVLGTTGETPTLSRSEKMELIRFTYDQVKERVPVIVGIGGNNTASVLNDLKEFPLEQATAILSAVPYYNKPSQDGLFLHYKKLAENAPKPIVLYNVPGRTGRNLFAETTLKLALEVGNIAGIKEASGDFNQCMQILKDKPGFFTVVSGDDALALPQMACGMQGVISVAANMFPEDFSGMIRNCLKNDYEAAKKLNDRLIPAYDLMFAENNPAGVKAFMSEKGLCKNILRLPVSPLSENLHNRVKSFLQKY